MISVAARGSPLSKAQVVEILAELNEVGNDIEFTLTYVQTHGDMDLQTSLRTLDKTDFFTREVDELVLNGKCQIAIHAAKDLPAIIPKGLKIAAITRGVDESDALVLRSGDTVDTLPFGATIATSSARREEAVSQLRSDFRFIDIRGTISQRLKKIETGEADGVVVAEAALIRLHLTHLNRIPLPGMTTPLQGRLAIVCKEHDLEMEKLFASIDIRQKQILYLGIDLPKKYQLPSVYHYPIIRVIPRPNAMQTALSSCLHCTHFLFTSKNAVRIFLDYFSTSVSSAIPNKTKIIVVGKETADCVRQYGFEPIAVAQEETSEGIVQELTKLDLREAKLFWPHSSLSRPIIKEFCMQSGVSLFECELYDTSFNKPYALPQWENMNEIVFTSPSTINAFKHYFGSLPPKSKCTFIGPITEQHFHNHTCSK